jgi:hypothetical protein
VNEGDMTAEWVSGSPVVVVRVADASGRLKVVAKEPVKG